MPHILLTGAGFSRNWGGWLADEAFEYLLSTHQIDGGGIRDLLWKYKRSRGGFEAALGYLQGQLIQHPHSESAAQNVERLKGAILQMFGDMNKNFVKRRFEFQDDQQYSMGRFLAKFDAIFTLNQDLLLEQRYIRGNYLQDSDSRWKQCETPGMERIITNESMEPIEWRWSPFSDAKKFPHAHDVQPYFKLHGSSNWIDTIKGQHLLVMGGNKPDTIKQHAILQWNHDRFNDHLSKPDTRLMIIGYSFGDEHINVAIRDAAEKGTLKLFIIDSPYGLDVLTQTPPWPDGYLYERLQPHLMGGSRRPLAQTFGDDSVEHGKVMRFFGDSELMGFPTPRN